LTRPDNQPQKYALRRAIRTSIINQPRHQIAILIVAATSSRLSRHKPLFLGIPIWLRVLVGTALVVPLMTYLVMPRMTRLFKSWLYPTAPPCPPVPVRRHRPL
jgi:antibiotic biosynthesis monooxygenase (ABM) superfamily enzyme